MAQTTIAHRYVLQSPLGRGAFGQVWQARDTVLGRPVAVKLVDLTAINRSPQLVEIVARFKREALAVGGMRHRNIVSAYDAGQEGSTLFLVMELVPGNSLAKLIEDRRDREAGPWPIADVLDIATQVCAGLSSAHAAGVVHRDIKPGNLMIDSEQQVKIIDFGIARFIHDDLPRLTVPGAGVGTLSYVAPEQAQGLEVDGRADLYSLGCTLYELLAGERPFVAAVPAALLNLQLSGSAPPLRGRRPDIPDSLAALVTQLMEKDQAERPASAHEVSDRLATIARGIPGLAGVEAARPTVRAGDARADDLAQSTPSAPPSATRPEGWGAWGVSGAETGPRRRRGRWVIASVFVLLAVIGAAVTFVWLRPHGSLAVTAVAVAPAIPPRPGQCDVTVNVVGTIVTNGRGGALTYQWTRSDGTTSPVQTAMITSGRLSERVHLYWTIRGRGTIHASAKLRVLSPSVRAASTSFVYSCR